MLGDYLVLKEEPSFLALKKIWNKKLSNLTLFWKQIIKNNKLCIQRTNNENLVKYISYIFINYSHKCHEYKTCMKHI